MILVNDLMKGSNEDIKKAKDPKVFGLVESLKS